MTDIHYTDAMLTVIFGLICAYGGWSARTIIRIDKQFSVAAASLKTLSDNLDKGFYNAKRSRIRQTAFLQDCMHKHKNTKARH
jgi:hypothetical protein